jgi:hypothetical protein
MFAPTVSNSSISTDVLGGRSPRTPCGPLIGIHAFGTRVVLINPDNMSEIAAFRGNQFREPFENKIAFATITCDPAER